MLSQDTSEIHVAEVSGPYGDFVVPESCIQQIWQDQIYLLHPLKTADGKSLEILNVGSWNHLEGPDFKDAHIKLDEEQLFGDIEIHIYPEDWARHKHGEDDNFRNVILHVSVFPGSSKGLMPLFVLLPHLGLGLEEIVNEVALMKVAKQLQYEEDLRPIEELKNFARLRWERKVQDSHKRLKQFGWPEAMHQLLLESLGSKRNRCAMSEIALNYSHKSFLRNRGLSVDELFSYTDQWKLNGVRPAAHPRRRLESYLSLYMKDCLDLFDHDRVFELFESAENKLCETTQFRKQVHLNSLVSRFEKEIFASQFSSSCVSTVICDVILPMIEAKQERDSYYFQYWYHWYMGNMPDSISRLARKYETPLCNGLAQGILHSAILCD